MTSIDLKFEAIMIIASMENVLSKEQYVTAIERVSRLSYDSASRNSIAEAVFGEDWEEIQRSISIEELKFRIVSNERIPIAIREFYAKNILVKTKADLVDIDGIEAEMQQYFTH